MSDGASRMFFQQIKDPRLAQYGYLIGSAGSGEALIIDPERDVDRYIDIAAAEGLRITAVAETHIHADFLSGARELAERCGAKLYLSGEGGPDWQPEWAIGGGYDLELLHDGSRFVVGDVEVTAVHTPGHTPEHLTFVLRDLSAGEEEPTRAVTGDFVFVGDLGRPDLLESAAGIEGMMDASARALYRSVRASWTWPESLQLWPGHGAGSACGKSLGSAPVTTWGAEKRTSGAIGMSEHGEQAFVDFILDGQPEPPPYFARMKRLNRDGVPLLPELPTPERLGSDDLLVLDCREDIAILDARAEYGRFAAGHVAGSLYAPLDDLFHTVVGSYVDPHAAIYLIAPEGEIEDLVRDLVRIGYDHVAGWLDPEVLEAFEAAGGVLAATEVIDFERLGAVGEAAGTHILDVRSANELLPGIGVPGAINVAHTRLTERLDEIPGEGVVAVYCRTGRRAARAAALLERHGYQPVVVDDDLEEWSTKQAAASIA